MQFLRNTVARLDRSGDGLIFFIFFLICIAVYFKSLTNGYSLDDDYILSDADVQRGVKAAGNIFSSRYITYYHTNYEYRPLAKLFFALEHQWFSLRPGPAHFINILLYFFSGVLLYRLLTLLKFIPGKAFAFIAVTFFLVHPLHTEVVCSIKNTDILLCSIFSFSACIAMLRFSSTGKLYFLAGSFLLLLAALFSKLDAITFCGIIPGLVFLNDRNKLRQAAYLFISFAVLYFVFVKTRKWLLSDEEDKVLRSMAYHENPLVLLGSLKHKLAGIFVSFGFYIEKILFPFRMAAYYGYNTIAVQDPFSQRFFYIGVLSASFFSWLAWKQRKNALVLAGILLLIGPISMYLNFPKPAPGIVADRFSFNAIAGIGLLITALLFRKREVDLKLSYATLAVAGCFIFASVFRSFDWKDRLTLIQADLKKHPDSAMLHYLRGSYLNSEADGKNPGATRSLIDSSISAYRTSLKIYEPNASVWNNLAGIYFFRLHDFDKAYPGFKRAFELDPHVDNKMLFAKSAFLSHRNDEFYKTAVAELNSEEGKAMADFINEFPQFLSGDSIKSVLNELVKKGVSKPDVIVSFSLLMKKKGLVDEEKEFMFLAFEKGYRNKNQAAELAEYYYDSGENEKASFLMDIYEGKIK